MPRSDHKLSDRDPSSLYGSVSTLVAAAITLLVAFGLPVSPDQAAAVLGFVAVLGPVVTAALIRRKAYAPQTHREELSNVAVDLEGYAPGGPLEGVQL